MINLPQLLDSNYHEVRRLNAENVQLKKSINPINVLSMDVRTDEAPTIGQYIRAFSSHGDQGIFRIISVTSSYGSRIGCTVYSEHAICTLADDYISDPIDKKNKTFATVLNELLSLQTVRRWQLGQCACNDVLSYTVQTGNLLQALSSLIQSVHYKYKFTYNFATTPWTLNVVATENSFSCECRLSRNINSCKINIDRSDMLTKLYLPDYQKQSDGTKRDPVFFIQQNTDIWGTVSGEYIDTFAADDATLLLHATDYLQQVSNPIITISIDAVELSSITNEPLDSFDVGKICRIALPEYHMVTEQRIVQISYADVLNDTSKCTVVLANRVIDASTDLAQIANNVNVSTSHRSGGGGGSVGQLMDNGKMIEHRIIEATKDISLVISDGKINYAAIVLAINEGGGTNITLDAETIDLKGYVTASQLSATNAAIENLKTGLTTAARLQATVIFATDSLYVGGFKYTRKGINVNGTTHYVLEST